MTLSLLSSQMFVQLHLVARALSFLGCISGIYVSGTLLTRSWRRRSKPTTDAAADTPTSFSPSNSIYGSWLNTAFPDTSTRTDAGSLLIFLCALGLLTVAMISESHHPSTYRYTDVPVISRLDDYNFIISVPENSADPFGARVNLAITACQDFMPSQEIQQGITFKWIAYDEDRVHHCDELDGIHNGYAIERDQHNVPIRHDGPHDSAGSRTSWDTAGTRAAARP